MRLAMAGLTQSRAMAADSTETGETGGTVPGHGDGGVASGNATQAGGGAPGSGGTAPSNNSPEPSAALIEDFLNAMAADRGLVRNSILAYRSDLAEIAAQLASAGHDFTNGDVDAIRTLLARWHREGLAPRTVSRRLSALRGMMSWLVEEGLRKDNPCRWIETPAQEP